MIEKCKSNVVVDLSSYFWREENAKIAVAVRSGEQSVGRFYRFKSELNISHSDMHIRHVRAADTR
ncbi:hypothetical protein TcasGA2_TC015116 [Tribolium castaneum]|uniref:Uncharacterized protein n=1 Tax=Tribolium castaneum TaxID=7070 RepID=D2A5T0_TRICA|nr:hypothetical protein TcasGA2_TC015116 [Tribolium castaneum]